MSPADLFDISPLVSARLAVWPGDTPPSREVLLDLARGDAVTLSTLHATVHLGAHADAPSHVVPGGAPVHRQPLGAYLGPCQVLRVRPRPGHLIGEAEVPGGVEALRAPRVLFATGTFPEPTRFTEDFAGLDPGLIEGLAARGVCLVGVDTPSVDPFASKALPAHHACIAGGIAILEGLQLGEVPDGTYELIALPLRLDGFDASPVRAVLRTLG